MRLPEKKKVTSSDIAEAVGVTRAVVSAVLNGAVGRGVRCSEDTRQRIFRAVEELGYRPNRSANVMREGRHNNIGVLLASPTSIPYRVNDFLVIIGKRYDQLMSAEHLVEEKESLLLSQDCCDALLLFERLPQEIEERINKLQIPHVYVNADAKDEPGHIRYDEIGGANLLVDAMTAKGAQRFIYVGPNVTESSHYSVSMRRDAVVDACQKHGLQCHVSDEIDEAELERADAIIAYDAERIARIQQTIDPIHDERQFACFGQAPFVKLLRGHVLVADIKPIYIARSAVTMALGLVDGKQPSEALVLPYEILNSDEVE
ncbi:MAG: LacI family DNA-binding transcriptional regulator [Planctomycetes bacterium]|nr:LacI family DNA-binding transcriptional regulator [Planctomycetota bacterium]